MNLLRRTICSLCMLLISITLQAQTSSNDTATFVDSLIQKMALKHQISEPPEEIRSQFEQNPLQISAEENKQLLEKFDQSYTPDLLLQNFKEALTNELTEQYQQEIANWLSSSDAQAITDARQFYYTLQGKRYRVINRYEMDENPPSEQRENLISTLADTTSVAEASVESSVIIVRSLIEAISTVSSQRNFSEAQVNAIAGNFRAQMEGQAGNQLNQQQLIMYHRVTDEALQNYITFWGTETGHWLDQAISEGMQSAYKKAANRFLQSVKNI